MQTEQLLCWSIMTGTEHSTTYGSNEAIKFNTVLGEMEVCNLPPSNLPVFETSS